MIISKKLCLSFALFCVTSSPLLFAETDQPDVPVSMQTLPIDDLRLFTEVFHSIRTNYVTEVTDAQLLEYAIKGMLNGLDPHSAYLNKNDFAELQEMTSGEFGGLGIEIIMENGFMKVVTPIDDSPAQRAGIKAADMIITIDGHPIKGLAQDDCINLMRGEIGSTVTITLMRENTAKPIELTMKRELIKLQSVKSRLLEKQWGYIRISQFQAQTGKDVKDQLAKMLDMSYNQMQGLVIDLRNNPGGMLLSAVETADLFLNKGLIVYTKGRTPDSQESYNATPEEMLKGKPIVVLINSGSASASEIVAGALQDQKRALIAGTTSFGKGSVQVILELPNDRGMKLTTARYYTPLGTSIQAEGIKPDVTIENAALTLQMEEGESIKESSLSNHLENKEAVKTETDKVVDALPDDYQLYEAINLLKAMKLSKLMPN